MFALEIYFRSVYIIHFNQTTFYILVLYFQYKYIMKFIMNVFTTCELILHMWLKSFLLRFIRRCGNHVACLLGAKPSPEPAMNYQ